MSARSPRARCCRLYKDGTITNPIPSPPTALVRPRVIDAQRKGAGPLLLEDVLRELLQSGAVGVVPLFGEFGSGKSTALLAMRERFVGEERLAFEEENARGLPSDPGLLVLRAVDERGPTRVRDTHVEMAPWTRDDLIEYLLAAHPDRCASVVARLPNVEVFDFFRGLPGLWRPVLDEMASDETVAVTVKALLHVLAREWPDPRTWRTCADVSARSVFGEIAWPDAREQHGDADPSKSSFLRYEPVRLVLAVTRFFERLANDKDTSVLASRVPPILLSRLGQELARHDEARALTESALAGTDATLHATAASVLNACDRTAVKTALAKLDWSQIEKLDLGGSHLDDVDLGAIVAGNIDLARASVARATFDGARIDDLWLGDAVLDGASLRGCRIEAFVACDAAARDVDFTQAEIAGALMGRSKLNRALFARTQLPNGSLEHAQLNDARFLETNLRETDLTGASVDGALFRDVDFQGAQLDGVDLRRCTLESTKFAHAYLRAAQLDGVQLPDGSDFSGADFTGAHLTGCRMQRANLRDARLNDAGLADVDFEGADLRGADFTNASFHLGSSRSGLVFDQVPMEGTRTGYYTDEALELAHKAPEEIRKANLRGCDLRGATIEACDFYLIDLRDAQLDPAQLEYVRRCGAILRRRE
ncbi:MAG: pentapeptide repeat-containing protein [Planctomycetota bacterium]